MAATPTRSGLHRDSAVTPHRPRKRFGQHFLHDPGVVQRLLAAIQPQAGQHVVEIGPGAGVLTRPLLAAAGALDVVELDRDLAARLQAEAWSGLQVHQADALKFDFAALRCDRRKLRLVGNLPYNISTPLLFHLLAQIEHIADMHFMLQKEVVERLAAAPGGSSYGRLTVMVRRHCHAERLLEVGSGAFRPPPRVESAVVRLTPHARAPVALLDEGTFATVVARAFGQRRKTLRNSLRGLLQPAAIEQLGIAPTARPETLTLAQFAALANRAAQRP